MQKALSELIELPEAELDRLVEEQPLLVTRGGEFKFVAQSLDAFESMVRRIRELEAASRSTTKQPGKLFLLTRN